MTLNATLWDEQTVQIWKSHLSFSLSRWLLIIQEDWLGSGWVTWLIQANEGEIGCLGFCLLVHECFLFFPLGRGINLLVDYLDSRIFCLLRTFHPIGLSLSIPATSSSPTYSLLMRIVNILVAGGRFWSEKYITSIVLLLLLLLLFSRILISI